MAQLLKVHGSQNHFFILDQTTLKKPLSDAELAALSRQLNNPQTGILNGADGILVVNHSDHPGVAAQMRVINADGSEALMCGNGIRTVARYVSEKTGKTSFKIATLKTDLQVSRQDDLADGVPAYAAEISPVTFNRESLPFDQLGSQRLIDDLVPEFTPGLRFTALAVPNPHLISFMDKEQLAGPLLGELGKRLNDPNPYFYEGVNVTFGTVLGHNQIFARTYERGVGFTNACGTGMSATSLALALTHPEAVDFDQKIDVFNPGGKVQTVLHFEHGRYWVELIGNATFMDKIDVDEDALHHAQVTPDNVTVHETGEQAAYLDFVKHLPRPVDIDVID